MYSKLSLRNVKRSVGDYIIYFLTLTFGVCIFYVFNSIESQQVMMDITSTQKGILNSLTKEMGYVSIFISIILGFLIIYANNFLVKRRKKEFGIYMTLGMDKWKVSRILLIETTIIGVMSLIVGLTLGVFLSQVLAVVTAKMFEVSLKSFVFAFSSSACLKTIIYFGFIFLLVMIFNSTSISKYKLIDLLNANKKNERFKVKKLWISVVLFIISILFIGSSYYLIMKNGIYEINTEFTKSIALGAIGTLLFFRSLSGFLIKVIQNNKKVYLKNINMFVLRQINSKINTTYVSMTVICLMLFITIGSLSTGMGISKALIGNMEQSASYDASMNFIKADSIVKLKQHGIILNNFFENYCKVDYYDINLSSSIFYETKKVNNFEKTIYVIKQTDYNKLMRIQGKPAIYLDGKNFMISCNVDSELPYVGTFLKGGSTITINGKKLRPKSTTTLTDQIEVASQKNNNSTLIVPDNILTGLTPKYSNIYGNYSGNKAIADITFRGVLEKSNIVPYYMTKQRAYEGAKGIALTVSYLAIYIGIIFLISSATVLALQQLSESADNIERYNLLKKIGVEQKMINKSVFIQIGIYFMMPLSLAIAHSVIGIKVASDVVSQFGHINIKSNTILIGIFIIFIYGGYFLATYMQSKSIIKGK